MFQARQKARQPIAPVVRRPRQVRVPPVQRNLTFQAAANFQPIPTVQTRPQSNFHLPDTPDHSKALADAIFQLSSDLDEQSIQVKQLGQSIDALKQVVDNGFENINKKLDNWLTKLDNVIEQDSVGKSADDLLEEEFLSLQ
ncbi:uncharacterized protein PG998_014319 [Apiospora kogelbergensis]|uniref:uncharacterized protein n=1 Tax=Apiospora kogelbergensis TaxID=1337665 RepID=UPI00312FEC40